MFKIQAKKFPLCTHCVRASSDRKSTFCGGCKKDKVHLFDSQAEASRFIYLKNQKHISNLQIQVRYPLYGVEENCVESWGGKTPTMESITTSTKHVIGHYTADFVYYDTNNPKMHTIEDYKPYNRITKAPIIEPATRLRLNILHKQLGKYFDIIVSCHDHKLGYKIKVIKPTKKVA